MRSGPCCDLYALPRLYLRQVDKYRSVNALAETTIGLYKTECVRDDSPFRHGPLATLVDIEEATSAWVHWHNTQRLMHRLGRIPPAEAEAEANYYTTIDTAAPAAHNI